MGKVVCGRGAQLTSLIGTTSAGWQVDSRHEGEGNSLFCRKYLHFGGGGVNIKHWFFWVQEVQKEQFST